MVNAMRAVNALLCIFPLAVLSHVHVSGVPVPSAGAYHRVFDPVDPNFCNAQAQQSPVSCLQNDPQGTPYCSSFIGIPTATVCTTATLPPVAGTTTITSTVTAGAVLPRYITEENTIPEVDEPLDRFALTQQVYEESRTVNTATKKRVLLPRQLVGCFPASESALYSSSLCSCLGIPTPTITTTFYATAAATATQIVTVTTTPIASATAQPLSTITITSGSVAFTSVVPTTISGVSTQVAVVGVPVLGVPAPSTVTVTSGSVAFTSIVPTIISGVATQVAVVGVPTPSTITITSGTAAFTSVVPTTINGIATQVAVVGVPAPSTITITSGSVAFTSVVPTTINGVATQVAVVGVPTPSVQAPPTYATTTSAWTSSYVLTTTVFTPTAAGQTGIVIVQTPVISYTTITRGGPSPTTTAFTQSPTNGGTLGSVIVETPATFVTTTVPIVYPFFTGATATYYPTGSNTIGTIIVQTYSSQVRPTAGTITSVTGTTSVGPALGTVVNSISPLVNNDPGTVQVLSATPVSFATIWTTSGSVQSTVTQSPDVGGTRTIQIILPTTGAAPFIGSTLTTTQGWQGSVTTSYTLYPTSGGTVCTEVILTPNTISTTTLYSGPGPTTVTLTATATTGGIASPVVNVILPSCTNTGIRYYDLDNPFLTTLFNPFYPNFVVEYFKNSSLPANYVGYADNINFVLPWTGDSQILSMPQRNNTFTTLVFQGYFAPTLTGVWNFTLFSNDDVTDIWMGPEAYSDWQTSNRLLRGTRGNINSYVANFLAGQYIPLTIVYANGPQTGALQLGITGPDNVYRNSTAGLFKWPSCAGDSFIKYPVNSPSPAPSSTTTITSGSVAFTSIVPTIISGVATQVAVVGVPTPSTITITSGTAAFTSVVPTTINGIATQVAVVGVPAPSTITITSGSVAFTSVVPTTINGIATQVAVVGVPIPSCTATGLTYNAYTNPFLYPVGAGAADPSYSGFNATYFNGLPASSVLYSGATNNISFNVPAAGGNLYGSPRTFIQTAIVYTGYFVPPVSGTYRLGFSSTDDVGYLWMGLPASAGTWGENNWNVRSTFFAPSTATVSQNFIAGQLYPIVIAVANGGGDGGLQFGIVTPAGSTVTDTTGYFLQPSCSTSGLTLATVQPSTGPGTPSRITITSGSVAFTSTVPTTISGVATQVAIVGVPALSTITITSGASLFTSTSTATVAGVATNVAVVVQPQTPFHIYVTDFSNNVYGYLDLNSSPVSAGTYNVSTTDYASSSLYYLDAATGQLAASPASGGITQPLYSVQTAGSPNSPLLFGTNQPTANTPVLVGQWPDGTLRLANTANVAQAASLCNGLLFVQPAVTAGCTQVVLSPVYNAVNYTTVTITSGTAPTTRTYGPAGTLVSSGGTVTDFVPAPTCTATGLAYAAYTNPFTGGGTNTNPYYTNYNATFFNSAVVGPALYSGVTNNINFNFGTGAGTLYGTPRTLAQTSLVYRGYFRTPSTGTYALNFPLSTLDDIAYVWMGGAVANNTWGESNWNLRATYNVVRGGSLTQNFIAGQLYPIVIEYGNAPGGAALQLNIVTPSGVTVTDTTGYFVQPSCASSGSSIGSSSVDITTCSATGIEWSLRTNAVLGGSTLLSPNYSLFVPELYNGATSPPTLAGGIVGNIQLGIAAPATAATLYNQGPYDMTQKAIIFRGYFAANVTGTWTFTFANPDEAAYMWLGPNAVSAWSKANANLFGSLNGAIGTYTVSLTAGTLYPIRMVMANAGGAMSFTLQTTDPLNVVRQSTAGFFRQIYCGSDSGWT